MVAAVLHTLGHTAVMPFWVLNNALEDAGLTSTQLQSAFGIDQGIDLTTFNALGDAMQRPNGIGLGILKVQDKPFSGCTM